MKPFTGNWPAPLLRASGGAGAKMHEWSSPGNALVVLPAAVRTDSAIAPALVVPLPSLITPTRTGDPFGGREQSMVRFLGTASMLVLLWQSQINASARAMPRRRRRFAGAIAC